MEKNRLRELAGLNEQKENFEELVSDIVTILNTHLLPIGKNIKNSEMIINYLSGKGQGFLKRKIKALREDLKEFEDEL